jgi:HD-GYP domain-containing protein (c-di-GMP phosphodiesterase class II)
MTDFDLQQIAGIIAEKQYEEGDIIIEEKTEAERFFIIYRGKIEISKRFDGGDKVVLSIQSDGAFFGEMAILDDGLRSASVLALEPTTVLEIQKDNFDTLLYKAPVLAFRILHELSSRLRETGALLISILTQKNSELYRAYIDTMTIVLKAAERRNPLAEGRSRRIADLCMSVARAMNVGDDTIPILEIGSLLHDIGMLSIPERILEKVDPLSPPELKLVRQHTINCIDMIESIPLLRSAVPYIRNHHENFDGSGYPDGLSGEGIPLPSRILAVVDAYEAMISERPYRRSRSVKEAKEEIIRCAGSQFDPETVNAFLRVLGSGKKSRPQKSKYR